MVRVAYLSLGLLCLALGYIGAVTPVMPSTIFFIIALWAFKRSSPRLEDWLLNRSFVGPTLQDWENERSMRLRTKIFAIAMVWVSIGFSVYVVLARHRPVWVVWVLVAVAVALTVFLSSIRTKSE